VADDRPIATADETEASYFHPVVVDVPLNTNTVFMTLIIETVGFRDDLKWRFSDGSSASFTAKIADEEFLSSIDNGERFGKHDRLDVEMRIDQIRRGDKLTLERTIVRVQRHLPAQDQTSLFSRPE
jgi:hypothetical protein